MTDTRELKIEIRKIRTALLIGLESFGEIERITDRYDALESFSQSPDTDLRPIHPTGAPDTIGVFACALRLLESMETQTVG